MTEIGAVKFAKMFGDHTTALAMLLHLSLRTKDFPDGEFKSGLTLAIEEGAAWLDSSAADDNHNAQTLMEQVVGLLNGAYCLTETPRGPIGVVI